MVVTLIGTPPNIVIATFREGALGEPFSMFDFAPVGIVVAITGNGYKTLDVFESPFEVDVTLRPNLRVFRDWYEGQQTLPVGAHA